MRKLSRQSRIRSPGLFLAWIKKSWKKTYIFTNDHLFYIISQRSWVHEPASGHALSTCYSTVLLVCGHGLLPPRRCCRLQNSRMFAPCDWLKRKRACKDQSKRGFQITNDKVEIFTLKLPFKIEWWIESPNKLSGVWKTIQFWSVFHCHYFTFRVKKRPSQTMCSLHSYISKFAFSIFIVALHMTIAGKVKN